MPPHVNQFWVGTGRVRLSCQVDLTTGLTFNIGTCISRIAAQQTRLTRRFAWATLATVAPCITSTWLVRLTITFVLATCFVARLVAPFTCLATLAAHLVTHFVAHQTCCHILCSYSLLLGGSGYCSLSPFYDSGAFGCHTFPDDSYTCCLETHSMVPGSWLPF